MRYKIFLGTALMLIHASIGYSQGNKMTWTDNTDGLIYKNFLDTSASLTNQSPFDAKRKGCRAAVYTGVLQKDRQYYIELKSDKMDTYLRLETANGDQVAENDDALLKGTNSGLFFRPKVTGTYRLIVTTYGQNETGPFQLVMGSETDSRLNLKAEGMIGVSGKRERGRQCEVFYAKGHKTSPLTFVLDSTAGAPLMMIVKNSKGETILEVKNANKAKSVQATLNDELISGKSEDLQIYVMPVTPRPNDDFRQYLYRFRIYSLVERSA